LRAARRESRDRRERPNAERQRSRDNPTDQRSNTIGGFGHYEDDLVKVNGQWFFSKRKIYNEGSARWQYKGAGNPAW
jgi:hypothetical protein